jgi:ABC-2 type transport system ATP-binding protein
MTVLSATGPTVQRLSPETRTPMVCVNGLVKRFVVRRRLSQLLRPGAMTTALAGISVAAFEGEIVGLLGPNGAGKTTLLKILSTLILPNAGSVEIGGIDVVRHPAESRRLVAPVSADERSLDWRLSARENLRFFGTLHGLSGTALRSRISELLETVELSATGEKLVGAFSSGMRQRLLIARGLLSQPKVLLLDEPTRSLDPLGARAFREFLRREIAGRQGCTILLATHDPAEALELCDRIAILDRGHLLASGTPSELTREFGDERYHVWSAEPDHAAFEALTRQGVGVRATEELDADGCSMVELELPAHSSDSATVLAALVRAGAPVSRFEKVKPTVADLMERVVRARRVTPHA